MTRTRTILAALLWLLAALAIAFGAAGLVTAVDAPPDAGELRPELTAEGDAAVTPALDAIESDLAAIATQVDALGTQARGALASLAGQDLDTVAAAVAAGDELLLDIELRRAAVATALGEVPVIGTPEGAYAVSTAVRERYDRLRAAVTAVDGLDGAWARLTSGSLAASRLSASLAAHDDAVLAAAELGRDARYRAAANALDDADAAIADARALRDVLANTVDVSVLDQWLDRNVDYDEALRGLYEALDGVGGRVTPGVRDAIDAERAAKDRLPPDPRGMVIIMADIGRGGMNGAVIAIEEARGHLMDALEPEPDASSTTTP